MRINYYRFPESVDATTRYEHGADKIAAHCGKSQDTCNQCPYHEGGWSDCQYYMIDDADDTISCTISYAKTMLKKFGGTACTQHCDRDGSVFETTPITLKGNNSEFHYNRHL